MKYILFIFSSLKAIIYPNSSTIGYTLFKMNLTSSPNETGDLTIILFTRPIASAIRVSINRGCTFSHLVVCDEEVGTLMQEA